MLYNKREVRKVNDKKVLHKVKKQWVTISLALLMAIGGGAAATHVNASANNDANNSSARTERVARQRKQPQGDNYSPGYAAKHMMRVGGYTGSGSNSTSSNSNGQNVSHGFGAELETMQIKAPTSAAIASNDANAAKNNEAKANADSSTANTDFDSIGQIQTNIKSLVNLASGLNNSENSMSMSSNDYYNSTANPLLNNYLSTANSAEAVINSNDPLINNEFTSISNDANNASKAATSASTAKGQSLNNDVNSANSDNQSASSIYNSSVSAQFNSISNAENDAVSAQNNAYSVMNSLDTVDVNSANSLASLLANDVNAYVMNQTEQSEVQSLSAEIRALTSSGASAIMTSANTAYSTASTNASSELSKQKADKSHLNSITKNKSLTVSESSQASVLNSDIASESSQYVLNSSDATSYNSKASSASIALTNDNNRDQKNSTSAKANSVSNSVASTEMSLVSSAQSIFNGLSNILSNGTNTGDNFDAEIVLYESKGPYAYVIQSKQGGDITLTNGEKYTNVHTTSAGKVIGTNSQGHQVLLNYQLSTHTVPQIQIKKTQVDPEIKFYYDNGDGSQIDRQQDTDFTNLTVDKNNENPDGSINIQTNISGYQGEPYPLITNDFYNPKYKLYPNFNLYDKQYDSKELGIVVLGEGGNFDTSPNADNALENNNDNSNYWYGARENQSSRVLNLHATRHFVQICYTYGGQKFYTTAQPTKFNSNEVTDPYDYTGTTIGHQTPVTNGEVAGVAGNSITYNNRNQWNSAHVAPGLSIENPSNVYTYDDTGKFDNGNDKTAGTYENPYILNIPLTPSNRDINAPVLLKDYDSMQQVPNPNGSNTQVENKNYQSGAPSGLTPVTVTINNTKYGSPNSYQISRLFNYYDPANDKNSNIKFDDNFYKPNNTNVLNGTYMVSEGRLNNTTDINGSNPTDQWNGIGNNDTPLVINPQGFSAVGAKSEWVDVNNGQIVPAPNPKNVPANIQKEMVPIIYYGTAKNGQYNDMTTAPNLYYNYRLWRPGNRQPGSKGSAGINDYLNKFVENSSISRNDDTFNTSDPTSYMDNYNNHNNYKDMTSDDAVNVDTTQQNATRDIAHSLIPSGTIFQQLPWLEYYNIDHFKAEDPQLPENDWDIQIVKTSKGINGTDTKGNGNVELRFIKVVPNTNGGVLYTTNGGHVTYRGIANGSNIQGMTITPSTDTNGTPGFQVTDNNTNKSVWYPQNAAILWDNNNKGFCEYHTSTYTGQSKSNDNSGSNTDENSADFAQTNDDTNIDALNGYYTFADKDNTRIQFNIVSTVDSQGNQTNPTNDEKNKRTDDNDTTSNSGDTNSTYQAQGGTFKDGVSFYLGDMNAYAQPVQYTVNFLGSQNYMNFDGNGINEVNNFPAPKNNGNNNDQFYPNYTQNSFTYTPNNLIHNGNYNTLGFAGDNVYFDSTTNGFYLHQDGQPQSSDTLLATIPKYNGQYAQQQNHTLVYDSAYEDGYLSSVEEAEQNEGKTVNEPITDSKPSWVLGIGDIKNQMWPDGSSLTDDSNENAVVYLADRQIKAQSTIHFVDLDTGYQFSEGDSGNGDAISQLFNDVESSSSKHGNKSEFDIASFLKGITDQKTSTLQSDGTWKLETHLENGDNADLYVIRTDSPSSVQPVNDTFIYVSTIDLGSPSNVGKYDYPLVVRYEDTQGNPIGSETAMTASQSDMETIAKSNYTQSNSKSAPSNVGVAMQGSHDFLVDGPVGDTVADAINGKNTSDTRTYDTYYNKKGVNPFWRYIPEGYHEVYLIPGAYHGSTQNYSFDQHNVDDDQNNQYITGKPIALTNNINDPKPTYTNVGEMGYTPVITIVLARNTQVHPVYVYRDLNGKIQSKSLGDSIYVPGVPNSDPNYANDGSYKSDGKTYSYENGYDIHDPHAGNLNINVGDRSNGASASSTNAGSSYNSALDKALSSEVNNYVLPDSNQANFDSFTYNNSFVDPNDSKVSIASNSQSANVNYATNNSGSGDAPVYVTAPGIQIHYRLINDKNLDGGNGSQSDVDLNNHPLYAPNPMPGTSFNISSDASSTDETTLNYYRTLIHATGYIPKNYIDNNYQVVAMTGTPMNNNSVHDGDALPTKFTYSPQDVYIYLQPKSHVEVHYIDAFNDKSLSDIGVDNDSLVAYNGSFGSMNTSASSSAGASYIDSTSGNYKAGELVYNPQITLGSLYAKGYRIDTAYSANYGNNSSEANITSSAANSTYSLDYQFNKSNEDSYNSTTSSYDQHHLIYNIYLTHSEVPNLSRTATVNTTVHYSAATKGYNVKAPTLSGDVKDSVAYAQSYTADAVTHSDISDNAWSLSSGQSSLSHTVPTPTISEWHATYSLISLPSISSTNASTESNSATSGAKFTITGPSDGGTSVSGNSSSSVNISGFSNDSFSVLSNTSYSYSYNVVYYPDSYSTESDAASATDTVNFNFSSGTNYLGSKITSFSYSKNATGSDNGVLNFARSEEWDSKAGVNSYSALAWSSAAKNAGSWTTITIPSYSNSNGIHYHLDISNPSLSSVGSDSYKVLFPSGSGITKALKAGNGINFSENVTYIPDGYQMTSNTASAVDKTTYNFYNESGSVVSYSTSSQTLTYTQYSYSDKNNSNYNVPWTQWSANGSSSFKSISTPSSSNATFSSASVNGSVSITHLFNSATSSVSSVAGSQGSTNVTLNSINVSDGANSGNKSGASVFASDNDQNNWVDYTEDKYYEITQTMQVNEVINYVSAGTSSSVFPQKDMGSVTYTRRFASDITNYAGTIYPSWSLSTSNFSNANVPASMSSSFAHVSGSGYGNSAQTNGKDLSNGMTIAASNTQPSNFDTAANSSNISNNASDESFGVDSTMTNWVYYASDKLQSSAQNATGIDTVNYLSAGDNSLISASSQDSVKYTRSYNYDSTKSSIVSGTYTKWSTTSNFTSINVPSFLSSVSNGKLVYYHYDSSNQSNNSSAPSANSNTSLNSLQPGGSAEFENNLYYLPDSYSSVPQSASVNIVINYVKDGSTVTSSSVSAVHYSRIYHSDVDGNRSGDYWDNWSLDSGNQFSSLPSSYDMTNYHPSSSNNMIDTAQTSLASNDPSLSSVGSNNYSSTISEDVYYSADEPSNGTDTVHATNTVHYIISGGSYNDDSISASSTEASLTYTRADSFDTYSGISGSYNDHRHHSFGSWTASGASDFNLIDAPQYLSFSSNGSLRYYHRDASGNVPDYNSQATSFAASNVNDSSLTSAYEQANPGWSLSGSTSNVGNAQFSTSVYYTEDNYNNIVNSAYVDEVIHYQVSNGNGKYSDIAPNASISSITYSQSEAQDTINSNGDIRGSWITTSNFSNAPSSVSVFGYHISSASMVSESSSYSADSLSANQTSTINEYIYYAKDNVSALSDSAEATNTVNYYISGTNTVISSSTNSTIQFSRADSYDAVTHTHSYGNWTSSAFTSDSALADISYSGGHYHLVTQSVAGLTPNINSSELDSAYNSANSSASSDSISGTGKSGSFNMSENVYYASDVDTDFSSDGSQSAYASMTISYLSNSNHSQLLATTYSSAITYTRDQYQNKYSSGVYSYGPWTIASGSSLVQPSDPSVTFYHVVSSPRPTNNLPTSLTPESITNNGKYSYSAVVYYDHDSSSSQTAAVNRNVEYIFSGKSNNGSSYDSSNYTSTQTVTYSRSALYNPDDSKFTSLGTWSISSGSFSAPSSSQNSNGWHVVSVESGFNTYPSSGTNDLSSGENSSHTYIVSYAPDVLHDRTNTSSATATIKYYKVSAGGSALDSSVTVSSVSMSQSENVDTNNGILDRYGSWVASNGFSLASSLSISGWTTSSAFNTSHPNSGYIPTSSFSVAANSSASYVLDVYYVQDSSSEGSNYTSAKDTINYLISDTSFALSSASSNSIQYSRVDSKDTVTGKHSYGSWATSSNFSPISYPQYLTSYGLNYHEVNANTTLPNVSQDSLNDSAANYTNNIYYLPDSTSDIINTSSATAQINYIEINSGVQPDDTEHQTTLASTSSSAVSMYQFEDSDITNSAYTSYGTWTANTGFTLPTSFSSAGWHVSSSDGYIPTDELHVSSVGSHYVENIYYSPDRPDKMSYGIGSTATAIDTVNYYTNSNGRDIPLLSASTSSVTFYRTDYYDDIAKTHSYGPWDYDGTFSVKPPKYINSKGVIYHIVSNGTNSVAPSMDSIAGIGHYSPSSLNPSSAVSYTNNIFYASDDAKDVINYSSATGTINYIEVSMMNYSQSTIASKASSNIQFDQFSYVDKTNPRFNKAGSWAATNGFIIPSSASISGWTPIAMPFGKSTPGSPFSNTSSLPTSAADIVVGGSYVQNVYYIKDFNFNGSNYTSAADTVNYLISGTNSALSSSATDSITYSRIDSEDEVTGNHSYGSWTTNNNFNSISDPLYLTSNGINYHRVSADTTLPNVSQASLDEAYSGANKSATSYVNNIYYASDNTANIVNTSSATATINYVELNMTNWGESSIASTATSTISMQQSENSDGTNHSFNRYGSWVASGFSLPTSMSIANWTLFPTLSNSGSIPTSAFSVASGQPANYVMNVYYVQDPSALGSNVAPATDTVNYLISGTSSAISSASTGMTAYSRADSYNEVTRAHSYGSWSGDRFTSISVPTSISFNGISYHEVSADSTVPSVTSDALDAYSNGNHSATSYVNDIYYAPDSSATSTAVVNGTETITYLLSANGSTQTSSVYRNSVAYSQVYSLDNTTHTSVVAKPWTESGSFVNVTTPSLQYWSADSSMVVAPSMNTSSNANFSYNVVYVHNNAYYQSSAAASAAQSAANSAKTSTANSIKASQSASTSTSNSISASQSASKSASASTSASISASNSASLSASRSASASQSASEAASRQHASANSNNSNSSTNASQSASASASASASVSASKSASASASAAKSASEASAKAASEKAARARSTAASHQHVPTAKQIRRDIIDHQVTKADADHMNRDQLKKTKRDDSKQYPKIARENKLYHNKLAKAKAKVTKRINKHIRTHHITPTDAVHMNKRQLKQTKKFDPKVYPKVVHYRQQARVKAINRKLTKLQKSNPVTYKKVAKAATKLARRINNQPVKTRVYRDVIKHAAKVATAQQMNYLAVHNPKVYRKILAEQQTLGINHFTSPLARKAETISAQRMAYLKAHNPKEYRKILAEQQMLGISHMTSKSARNYVNGINDARRGFKMLSHNAAYVKGYEAFKKANGGKLPQTGEVHSHMSLAAAVMLVLSLTFSIPAIKRRKHNE